MTTSEAPTETKRTRPRDRRDQILREAMRLISISGFNGVSLADVAKATGIQKSSVLHHFPSMNDLLFAVLQVREDQDYEFYRESADNGGPSDIHSVRALFTRVFHHNLDRPELVRLYSILSAESLDPKHPAHEYFAFRARTSREEVARNLFWKSQPEIAAAEFLAFWDGLELSWRHDPNVDAKAVWESFCDRFFV